MSANGAAISARAGASVSIFGCECACRLSTEMSLTDGESVSAEPKIVHEFI